MKKIRFYAMLVLAVSVAVVACQQKEIEVLGDSHEKTGSTGNMFRIWCASMEEDKVTLELRHGGSADHEFTYTWDGTLNNPYPDSAGSFKEIVIVIGHKGTNQQNETLTYEQTVSFNLSELNIKTEDLKHEIMLKFKNTTIENNDVFLWSYGGIARNGECLNGTGGGGDGDSTLILR